MPNAFSDSRLVQAVTRRLEPFVSTDLRTWVKHAVEAPLIAHDITRLAEICRASGWR